MALGERFATVDDGLEHYGGRWRPHVDTVLRRPGPIGDPARWLYDVVAAYPSRLGKGLRPGLCLATCEAFGGRVDEALPSAAAIELLHNAFLVHDDIQDDSRLRRGEPTLHVAEGLALALNAGDALAVLGQGALRANPRVLGDRLAAMVAAEFDTMARRTLEGQSIELGWVRDGVVDLTPDDYLDMVMRKTCWYTTIHPMRIGALIGSWGVVDLDPFVRFGFHLGAAFQIRDDLLNLVGDEAVYGKELLGDLLEGKRSLMVIHLLQETTGSTRADLVAYLRRERVERTATDAAHVLDLMREHGSLDFASAFSAGIAEEAEGTYEAAFAGTTHTGAGRFVRALIPYMLDRAW